MAGYIGSKAAVVSNGAERKKTYSITGTTTSLTGLSYTVNQVHVFHNGVRLVDGTDFTATNGNSITLTNAAQSGDEVVVISYAGYQVSDTVSASQGGTFSGALDVNASSATVLTVDRESTDGTIVDFQKDGTSVGGIYSQYGLLSSIVLDPRTNGVGLTGINAGTGSVLPAGPDGVRNDALVGLGDSQRRFKDLYLSGGVYLGGTGAANYLDDYEEGTWTPTMHTSDANLTATIGIQFARYVKIGQLVYVSAYIVPSITAGSSGYAYLSSLPFAVTSATGAVFPWFCVHGTALSSSGGYLGGNGRMIAIANNSTSGINWNAGIQYLMFNCSYMTDA